MKDPAFLFYPESFAVGTRKMTDEEVGQYIRALCEQFFEERIDEQYFENLKPSVQEKFTRVKGGYINKRLRMEIEKRRKYSNSRHANGSKGGRPKKQNETTEKPTENHMVLQSENHMRNININRNINIKTKKEENAQLIQEVVSYLNETAGKNYKPTSAATQRHINARLAEGFTLEDFRSVIDKQTEEWRGTEWEKYLRPETLFNGEKFEGYLQAPRSIEAQEKEKQEKHRQDEQAKAREARDRLRRDLADLQEQGKADPTNVKIIREKTRIKDELERVDAFLARAE